MADSLEQRVCRVVSDVFGLAAESVNASTSIDTVETWDSFNILNLMMALEAEFDTILTPDEASELMSVEAIVGILAAKGLDA